MTMNKLRRDTRGENVPDMHRMVAVTTPAPRRSRSMLRARLPLAVASLAAAVAVLPATAASAAPLDGTPLGSVLTQAQSGAGSSGAPDVQGSLTDFTTC